MTARTSVAVPLLAGLLAIASAGAAFADSRYLPDLEGKRVNDAVSDLSSRGYRIVGTEEEGGGTQRYAWNPRNEDCVVLNTRDGKVRDVRGVSSRICRDMDGGYSGHDRDRYEDDRYRDDDYRGYGDRDRDRDALPREITSLAGKKRKDAESALSSMGFVKIDGEKARGRTNGLWWNKRYGDCVSVEAQDGKVRQVYRESRSVCD